MRRLDLRGAIAVLVVSLVVLAGCSSTQQMQVMQSPSSSFLNLDTVKAGRFDTGKMWTFDFPPVDYFKQAYNFQPGPEWFEKARLAALRLPGCTASFVSGDGLVMTNHHCARGALDRVNKEGEDLPDLGFYAPTMEEERKVPGYYVDQLVLMEDVTSEVQKAFESGKTDEERVANRDKAIQEIQQRYNEKTGLRCSVVTFYNGGRYSLYGYKRYTDVRLVFAPEQAIAFYGGDPDNFTYPRYDLDISFFRVYDDDGKPLKSPDYFAWSPNGASEGEPVFVIGNPGRTSRLFTVSQLEFNRDYVYPYRMNLLLSLEKIYSDYIAAHPESRMKYQTRLFGIANARKVYVGLVQALRDPVFMAKKKDFERTFKNAVFAKPMLKSQYGGVWDAITAVEKEKSKIFDEQVAYGFRGRSAMFYAASQIVDYAKMAKMPEAQRPPQAQGGQLDSLKQRLAHLPVDLDLEPQLLTYYLTSLRESFGDRNSAVNTLLAGRTPEQAAEQLMATSVMAKPEGRAALLNETPDQILASNDPVVKFVVSVQARGEEVEKRAQELRAEEEANVQLLGKALFDVYGTSIPPDATFTLRIADGVVKKYDYNGTIAPVNTTFYGLYDRYYSFHKQAPWDLPDRWKTPPPGLELSTPLDFVSTNDIIGGNSGSPVVNEQLQIVGIAFDGNIESLPGEFIYTDVTNRCVAVHTSGIMEALKNVYKADRIVKELESYAGGK